MIRHGFRKAISPVFAIALTAMPALAQEARDGHDADGLEAWSEEQFAGRLGQTGLFETFDADADGRISAEEYAEGLGDEIGADAWEEADADRDGVLDGEEFASGLFGQYDTDDDGFLEEVERMAYGEQAEEEGWF